MEGVSAFAGISSDPNNFTNKGYNYSYGGGVRGGVQWSVMPNFRVGFSGQSPVWMTAFNKYRGLFAEHGGFVKLDFLGFDIPANLTAGVAWDAMPGLTLMVDYKHIFYGSIPAPANPMASLGLLGMPNGIGFGWHDVDVFKVGVEWRASTFNILAPGVVTDHITGGFAYKSSPNSTWEFAAAYVPSHSVSGPEVCCTAAPPLAVQPGSNIEIEMHQYQFTLGYTYNFAPPAPTKMVHK